MEEPRHAGRFAEHRIAVGYARDQGSPDPQQMQPSHRRHDAAGHGQVPLDALAVEVRMSGVVERYSCFERISASPTETGPVPTNS